MSLLVRIFDALLAALSFSAPAAVAGSLLYRWWHAPWTAHEHITLVAILLIWAWRIRRACMPGRFECIAAHPAALQRLMDRDGFETPQQLVTYALVVYATLSDEVDRHSAEILSRHPDGDTYSVDVTPSQVARSRTCP